MTEFRQTRDAWIQEQIDAAKAELAELEASLPSDLEQRSDREDFYLHLERVQVLGDRLKTLRNRKRGY